MKATRLATSAAARWTGRGLAAIVDQGISSAAGLLVTILLARWLSLEEFGAYALAGAIFGYALQFQNGLVLEPMSVIGPAEHEANLAGYLAGQLRLGALLLGAAGLFVVLLVGALRALSVLGAESGLLLVLGISIPFMATPWLVRRILYTAGRPERAMLASLAYALTLSSAILALGFTDMLSAQSAIGAMALCGIVPLIFVSRFLRSAALSPPPAALQSLLSTNWRYGRWVTLTGLLVATAVQAQLMIAGAILGLAATGIVRAAQNLIQPMAISITAVSAVVLPSLARHAGRHDFPKLIRRSRVMTLALTLAAVSYFVVLLALGQPLLRFAYGANFAQYGDSLAIWAIVPVIMALNSGMGASLKARQRPELGLVIAAVWAMVSVALGIRLTLTWGIRGAALSAVAGYVAAYLLTIVISRRVQTDVLPDERSRVAGQRGSDGRDSELTTWGGG